MNYKNIGLIGFGTIGKVHLQAITNIANKADLRIVAIASSKDFKPPEGIRLYKDRSSLICDPAIHAIAIATPPNTHYEIALEALRAGRDVLLEKPPTISLAQLEKLNKIACEKKCVLFTAFHSAYRPEINEAHRLLADKDVVDIHIEYKEDVMRYHDPDGWIFDMKKAGGGVLIDSGINAMSIVCKVLPRVNVAITNATLGFTKGISVETSAHIEFSYGNGGNGILTMDWMHKCLETRQISFTTKSRNRYTIDIVKSTLTKNDRILVGIDNDKRAVDMLSEYCEVYLDFDKHCKSRESYVSKRELKFVIEAYNNSTSSQHI